MPFKETPPRKRIEYRGENIRFSRTSDVSATKTVSKDGYGATVNTNHGVRLHKRLFKGARMGFQNGNFQFIGRYNSGPFNFNVSKAGFSTSIKNKRGSYNIIKPNYSSFKLAGVQVRGKNAATLQLLFIAFTLVKNVIKLLWHIMITMLWRLLVRVESSLLIRRPNHLFSK
ncbi:hypothetical protein [uncultured Nonlabens sp.]|uniref:hypothetical protein n=1 Tax=uncultured Nonlabens sp. TaxID=859306 RepID=UPI0030D85964|tara:strand:+ start:12005 stop:12517 length:513 start_codon:yes stop_codon:yes gene_type:complete